MMIYDVQIKELERVQTLEDQQDPAKLIVHNDEINTFDWVTRSLVEVCKHDFQQAEQCTWIIHYKGKYAVKEGALREMRTMREALVDRGIGATVEY